jgi:hypothetical protein
VDVECITSVWEEHAGCILAWRCTDSVRVIHIGNRPDAMEWGRSQSLFLGLSDRPLTEPEHRNCGPEDGGITYYKTSVTQSTSTQFQQPETKSKYSAQQYNKMSGMSVNLPDSNR